MSCLFLYFMFNFIIPQQINKLEGSNSIAYANLSAYQTLNISLSPYVDRRKKQPAILIIQGDNKSNKEINTLIKQNALNNGYAAVEINYRDTTKYPFPAQIQDVNSAIRWIKKFGHKYNIAPDKLFLFGASENGYLATLAGITATYLAGVTDIIEFGNSTEAMQAQEKEQKNQNYVELFCSNQIDESTKVIGVIDFYGYLKENEKYYTPMNYITPLSPPIIMVYGENDKTIPLQTAINFYNKLKNSICPPGTNECYTKLLTIKNGKHGGSLFYNQLLINKVFIYINNILLEK